MFSRFRIRTLNALLLPSLLLVSACSNLFSSNKNQEIQNFHSQNSNCAALKFSNSEIAAQDLRALIHCLNSNLEISPLEDLVTSFDEETFQEFTNKFNYTLKTETKSLFAFREGFQNYQRQGDWEQLQRYVSTILSSSKQNLAVSKIINKLGQPLSRILADSDVKLRPEGIYTVLHSSAYQRLAAEYFNEKDFPFLATSLSNYFSDSESLPLEELADLLNQDQFQSVFKNLFTDKNKIERVGHTLEWLFADQHYINISLGLESLLNHPIQCFQGKKTLGSIVSTGIDELSQMNSKQAAQYLNQDIATLNLLSNAYCTIPSNLDPMIRTLKTFTEIKGYDEIYSLIKPLLNDPRFIKLVSSSASRHFIQSLNQVKDGHLVLDILNLGYLVQSEPAIQNTKLFLKEMSLIVKKLSTADYQTIYAFLAPLANESEKYGFKLYQLVDKCRLWFPDSDFQSSTSGFNLQKFTKSVFLSSTLGANFDLLAQLINEKKLTGLIQQTLNYFSFAVERGKYVFKIRKFITPPTSTQAPSEWKLEKLFDTLPLDPCRELNLSWNFAQYQTETAQTYLNQLEVIQRCYENGSSFSNAKALLNYAITSKLYSPLMTVQNSITQTFFEIDGDLSMKTGIDFLELSKQNFGRLHSILISSSHVLQLVKDDFLTKINLKKLLGLAAEDRNSYLAVSEHLDLSQARTRSQLPSLDLTNLKKINVIVERNVKFNSIDTSEAVSKLVFHYCPSLDVQNANCSLDSDQVVAFKTSPGKLYSLIAEEYLGTPESWAHPKQFKTWEHHTQEPENVATLEYHLNPLLHSLRNAPQVPRAVFKALQRSQKDQIKLRDFLKDRALRITLIPYFYQNANYPSETNYQYTNRIRLRLVSDLDRLELIANNADFKAFNLAQNIGMGFIRDIGLAWGDVALSNRPVTLNNLAHDAPVLSLKEVSTKISDQLTKFDLGIIQRIGDCDPSGKRGLGRWLISRVCSPEWSDISARLFNLRFLIGLLDDELPKSDGGNGGLVFLRDLFFSLYEANTNSQRDTFSNGVNLRDQCIQDPLSVDKPSRYCQRDLLTLIPRITHLGLLHQAGLAVLNHQDHPIDAVSNLLNDLSAQEKLVDGVSSLVSSDNGILFLQDLINYSFQAPASSASNLKLFSQLVILSKDLNWIQVPLAIAHSIPKFSTMNQELLNSILGSDFSSIAPHLDYELAHPESSLKLVANSISSKIDNDTISDLILLSREITTKQAEYSKVVIELKDLDSIDSNEMKRDAKLWLDTLSSEGNQKYRQKIATSLNYDGFNQFCVVFSDSHLMEKTYSFLESLNQNSDSIRILNFCKNFLDRHP